MGFVFTYVRESEKEHLQYTVLIISGKSIYVIMTSPLALPLPLYSPPIQLHSVPFSPKLAASQLCHCLH